MSITSYQIVLFNNKSKKRIVATSRIFTNINKKYKEIHKKSNVIFPVKYNKKIECSFELALVCVGKCKKTPIHRRDELGRLTEVTMKSKKYQIIKIKPFSIEEKVYDHQLGRRIEFGELYDKYLSSKNIIQIYSLNNKVVIQNNDLFNLFSLKNVSESSRFLSCIKKYFTDKGKFNFLISRDLSTIQRKELYNLLESKGFSRKLLYKHYTY
tara:strand:+ start:1686 stop:2318 length:633 start_codon:yes stop_codon:yes gene_type:complete